jgi:hypothetical protein
MQSNPAKSAQVHCRNRGTSLVVTWSRFAALVLVLLFAGRASAQVAGPQAWGVNPQGQLVQWNGSAWASASVAAPAGAAPFRNVAAGADGTVVAIGQAGNILRLSGNQWQSMPGQLVQASAGGSQNIWGVNSADDIYRWTGAQWINVPGKLVHVSVAADGSVWGVNRGGNVFRMVNGQWQAVPGQLVQVSVGNAQSVWGVTATDDIVRWSGSQWQAVDGKLIHVAVAADGSVWGVNRQAAVYRREGMGWVRLAGELRQISAVGLTATASATASPASTATTPANASATGGVQLSMAVIAPVANAKPADANKIVIQSQEVLIAGSGSSPLSASTLAAVSTTSAAPVLPLRYLRKQPVRVRQPLGSAKCGGPPNYVLCSKNAATLVGVENGDAAGGCPAGSFMDLGKSSCWKCPEGYDRSAAAVDSERACSRALPVAGPSTFLSASYRGPLCPPGSFHDPIRGGECYSCPPNYSRSLAHIDAANACFLPSTETLTSAIRHNAGLAWDCSGAGVFWDGKAPAGCWSCPAGYNRTGYVIDGGQACSRATGDTPAKATLMGKAECRTGEFHDIKIPGTQDRATGGGCYTCPTGTDRTVLAVDGTKACEKDGRFDFQSATRTKSLFCPPGQFWDGVRTTALSEAIKREMKVDSGTKGTCWVCPYGTDRTADPVWSGGACAAPDIVWESPLYDAPGLFGLDGAEDVVADLIKQRTLINAMADDLAKTLDKTAAQSRADAWQGIAEYPETNVFLHHAVYSRLQAVAMDASAGTPAERRLLASAEAAMREFRVFIAQDALDAYRVWKASNLWRESQVMQSTIAQAFKLSNLPPDFEQMSAEAITAGLSGSVALGAAWTGAMMSKDLQHVLFPFRDRKFLDTSTKKSADAVKRAPRVSAALDRKITQKSLEESSEEAAELLVKKGVQATGNKLAKEGAMAGLKAGLRTSATVLKAMMSSGPQIIIEAATEIMTRAIEVEIEAANAEPKLLSNLANAKNGDFSFKRMMGTANGFKELDGSWGILMSGTGLTTRYTTINLAATAAQKL